MAEGTYSNKSMGTWVERVSYALCVSLNKSAKLLFYSVGPQKGVITDWLDTRGLAYLGC